MKNPLSEIKKLEKERNRLSDRIRDLNEAETGKTHLPFLKKFVGKCFAYRNNCFSCPKKKSDYWDVFRKILGFVEHKDGSLAFIFEEFEVDGRGKATFSVDSHFAYMNKEWWGKHLFAGYEEITEEEYQRERTSLFLEMSLQKKMRRQLIK